MNKIIVQLLCSLLPFSLSATIINVPGDHLTIQSAIIASSDGDTVLVEPGTYYENINFRGHKIVLTSRYFFNNDTSYICSTIINGSQPLHPDTGTCIILNNGEDETTIIQGFTITGGTGTAWLDVHGAGIYREGGAIITEFASPVIRNNYVVYNLVVNTTGVNSTGGGGIRCGDGHPHVYNNVIAWNQARYGGGIVFNYCDDARLFNNLIVHNSGGQSFGGGGIWATGTNSTTTLKIENNTIANNHSLGITGLAGKGGAMLYYSITVEMVNNIVWGNTQYSGTSIRNVGGVLNASYTNIDYNLPGNGNISADPFFADTISFLLTPISPAIDAGDSTFLYNDITTLPSVAQFPSMGTERNDIGVYGGPYSIVFPVCPLIETIIAENLTDQISVYPNPANEVINIKLLSSNYGRIQLFKINGQLVIDRELIESVTKIQTSDLSSGTYFIRIITNGYTINNLITIEH